MAKLRTQTDKQKEKDRGKEKKRENRKGQDRKKERLARRSNGQKKEVKKTFVALDVVACYTLHNCDNWKEEKKRK